MSNVTIVTGKSVTVRVKGENKRLSRVVLEPMANGDTTKVRVMTGKRGRPRHLPVEAISSVTVLKS